MLEDMKSAGVRLDSRFLEPLIRQGMLCFRDDAMMHASMNRVNRRAHAREGNIQEALHQLEAASQLGQPVTCGFYDPILRGAMLVIVMPVMLAAPL